jgi:cytochrome c-type biogenesis protein CcmH/NrfG
VDQGSVRRRVILCLVVAALGGCSPGRGGPASSDPAADPQLPAVQSLLGSARAAVDQGDLERAAADLERALRLQPGNPGLWHELARVRLAQGEFDEAESLALRSNSLSGRDSDIVRRNWELIAASRDARGDEEGARSAREAAGG